MHGQRLWLTNEGTGDEVFNGMNAEIESGARYLATAKVDVIVYGCTTGSFFKSPGWDLEMRDVIQRAAGVPAVATTTGSAGFDRDTDHTECPRNLSDTRL